MPVLILGRCLGRYLTGTVGDIETILAAVGGSFLVTEFMVRFCKELQSLTEPEKPHHSINQSVTNTHIHACLI